MSVRTSASHPLRVDFVDLNPLPGRLGLTLAPGKKGTSYFGGSWGRSLEEDLRELTDTFGADVLVSLLEAVEFPALGIPDLLERAEGVGLRVRHLPIRDGGTPATEAAGAFAELVDAVLDELRAGATVVVHCRGGLGRSGLVVAAVLTSSGLTADEAIAAVRSVRPGAVETREQEHYVQAFAQRQTLRSRYRGALLGLAAGDALGTTVEFRPPGSFEPLTDIVGGGPFHLASGRWTDDTSMALCLAESLVACRGFDVADQMHRYVRWWREGYWSSTGRCFDIGISTRAALQRFLDTGEPFAGSRSPHAAGNGSIMRLAPVPMAFASRPREAIERAVDSSRTTHGSLTAVDACRYLAALLVGALSGEAKEALLRPMYAPVAGLWQQEPLCDEIAEVAGGSFRRREPPEIRGEGYVVRSLEAALWAFDRSDSFEAGARLAVNLGDDSDTTGAVYGQLAGASYGEDAIPADWRELLAFRSEIAALADGLLQLREEADSTTAG